MLINMMMIVMIMIDMMMVTMTYCDDLIELLKLISTYCGDNHRCFSYSSFRLYQINDHLTCITNRNSTEVQN